MRISKQKAAENHSRLEARNDIFRRHGMDVKRNMDFVLAQALPLPGRILEIGTGQGRFLTALLSHVSRVTTVDIDPTEQECARLNVAHENPSGRARFMIANAAKLPWADRSFENVISVNAMHHMKELSHVIDEAVRVAKPKGRIILADFSARGFVIMNKIHRDEDRIHEHITYSLKNLIRRFSEHGWTAVQRSADCQTVLIAVKAANRSVPPA